MTDETLEQRVQTVAERLRAKPQFMALLLNELTRDQVRVAGSWVKDTTTTNKEAHKLPNLSQEGHNISIIFPQETGGHFKWLIYSKSGTPTKTGYEETLEEAKDRAEEEAVKRGIILTDQIKENHGDTVSPWTQQPTLDHTTRWCRIKDEATTVAAVEGQRDGTWMPWVQGIKDFKPFYLLEDAMKAVDDILVSVGHVLPPEED